MTTNNTKTSIREKIGYGLGDMSSSMFWKIFSYYLPIFYSDVFGLKPAHAAMLLLITKLYDAVSDPVMGLIAAGDVIVRGCCGWLFRLPWSGFFLFTLPMLATRSSMFMPTSPI